MYTTHTHTHTAWCTHDAFLYSDWRIASLSSTGVFVVPSCVCVCAQELVLYELDHARHHDGRMEHCAHVQRAKVWGVWICSLSALGSCIFWMGTCVRMFCVCMCVCFGFMCAAKSVCEGVFLLLLLLLFACLFVCLFASCSSVCVCVFQPSAFVCSSDRIGTRSECWMCYDLMCAAMMMPMRLHPYL